MHDTRPEARREILLALHVGRKENLESASRVAELLLDGGLRVRTIEPADPAPIAADPVLSQLPRYPATAQAAEGVELVLVLGGDGTFLRAADIAFGADLPVLGINLGHVGFLAEWEAESLELAAQRIIDRDYRVENRMTIAVRVLDEDLNVRETGWALNEVSIENLNRRGVLDAVLEVDGRPVSSFGCDGVLISTPTGSTAYAFSAGGPVLWPELDAILVVPNNAHALFTKPLVVSPHSTVAVESAPKATPALAVMDGFRPVALPPGSRVEVVRGQRPVRWVRLDDRPFTDRLVTKLRLPVEGWRGPNPRRKAR
ncbi:NAD kinase [Corynebacterium atypicum]|uniref:NAD kinase n=1 Tax=Corynebacterium atypicum TaxID=191610 RepID=UPI0006896BF3|nr:NAD kinase [Corynebacterium atypicum]